MLFCGFPPELRIAAANFPCQCKKSPACVYIRVESQWLFPPLNSQMHLRSVPPAQKFARLRVYKSRKPGFHFITFPARRIAAASFSLTSAKTAHLRVYKSRKSVALSAPKFANVPSICSASAKNCPLRCILEIESRWSYLLPMLPPKSLFFRE